MAPGDPVLSPLLPPAVTKDCRPAVAMSAADTGMTQCVILAQATVRKRGIPLGLCNSPVVLSPLSNHATVPVGGSTLQDG